MDDGVSRPFPGENCLSFTADGNRVFCGDAFDLFRGLERESVNLIITSPPYWGHREYGLEHNWDVFNDIGTAKRIGPKSPGYDWYRSNGGVLGLEPYPEWYIAHLVEILALAKDCLKPSGSMWINMGDTYFARWSSIRESGRQGLGQTARLRRKTPMGNSRQEKQMLLIPAKVAVALQNSGWILRNDLIWYKPNTVPRPEGDRLRSTHEHFFHFVQRPTQGRATYYYDMQWVEPRQHDVVTVNVSAGEEGHTATFPRSLIIPRILSSCPTGGLVLDPFCGTGRALDVAMEFGRRALGFEKNPTFLAVAGKKMSVARGKRAARPTDSGNFVSEWFGRRIHPLVRVTSAAPFSGSNRDICPFLSETRAEPTRCWKNANSRGVCTISSVSNGTRQDWLVCPHRVIHTDLVKRACATIFQVSDLQEYPVAVSALRKPDIQAGFRSRVARDGVGYVFFQDKLGGEISISGTASSPEMKFDVTVLQVAAEGGGRLAVRRYGFLEIQTMDYHGSYQHATSALRSAIDLHGNDFAAQLQANIGWAGREVEGPNIANVFKRTFYQVLIKFQLAAEGAAAGTVLAIPRAVWDSWQPFLGAPKLIDSGTGYETFAEATDDAALNSSILIFDIDAAGAGRSRDGNVPPDISPVFVQKLIRVSPQTLASHAFQTVPQQMLNSLSGSDSIMLTIKSRLQAEGLQFLFDAP